MITSAEAAAIFQAMADGKTVQVGYESGRWYGCRGDVVEVAGHIHNERKLRVKTEPIEWFQFFDCKSNAISEKMTRAEAKAARHFEGNLLMHCKEVVDVHSL